MGNKKFDFEDRLVAFAAEAILFCKELPRDMSGEYYGNQLLRSAGSAALNFGEAQGTNTTKDYINKAGVSLKELKESRVNLKILEKVNYGDDLIRNRMLEELEELIKILATIIKNKKKKL